MTIHMTSRYRGKCNRCGGMFPAGERIEYDRDAKTAAHVACPDSPLVVALKPISAAATELSELDVTLAPLLARREELRASLEVSRGSHVTVMRGRKVPVGTTGVVIWTGFGKFGARVGVKDDAGTVHWTAASNVEVSAVETLAEAA